LGAYPIAFLLTLVTAFGLLQHELGLLQGSKLRSFVLSTPGAVPPPPLLERPALLNPDGDTGKPKVQRKDSPLDAATRKEMESPLLLDKPANLKTDYQLSDDANGFYIYEKAGTTNVKPPSYIEYDDLLKLKLQQNKKSYFKSKVAGSVASNPNKSLIPDFKVNSKLFETIFGSNVIDIKPNVNVLMDFSGRINRMQNPQLTARQQVNSTFNFNQQIQMNVVGKIGDRLKLNVSYDTQATFNFENQFKINFEGKEDDIIKSLEAGNVSMPLNGSLITGGQNLWGVKTKLQFGPVFVTAVASQQRGKTNEITIKGGAQQTPFTKKVAEYDEQRHFFLNHYFRSIYERSLINRPFTNSPINIVRVEVWVTNRGNASTSNNRNAIGFVDLAENDTTRGGVVYNPAVQPAGNFPSNEANNVYNRVKGLTDARLLSTARDALNSNGFQVGSEYEIVENLRRLNESEYTLNPQLGYIMLSSKLQMNDVLFIAYEYTVAGQPGVFRVGEFSTDVPANQNNTNLLYLKMLKPSDVRPRLNGRRYPTWDLMMKNIYSIGGYNLQPDNFELEIVYEATDGSGDINYLPASPNSPIANIPLIQVFGVDTLRNNLEIGADNKFDFIKNVTVIAEKGLVVFPKLEPFGSYLAKRLKRPGELTSADSLRYAYTQLYTETQVDAIQYFPQLNRFKFRGKYASAAGADIMLNAVQVAQGSVKVMAGGSQLAEGVDYTVDYQIGKVTILNPGILSSGQDIKITFETNTLFGIDQKTMVGIRLDYALNKDIQFGATLLHLNERPLINKVVIGNEPITNTLWGLDVAFKKDSRFITNLLDKLPFYSTKEVSTVTVNAEFAQFVPGVASQLSTDTEKGIAYMDDFEGTRQIVDLSGILFWKLASTPPSIQNAGAPDDPLRFNYNRAKLAWYLIDPIFTDRPSEFGLDTQDSTLNDHYSRRVEPKEIFPGRTLNAGQNVLSTFDVRFFPNQRGQYNYQTDPSQLNPDGTFRNPRQNWAGIMRRTTGNTDFEAANFEYIEFWVMDPFLKDPTHTGGDMYINLGKVSEDVLPDGRRSYENGLPTTEANNNINLGLDSTAWGRVPNVQQPTSAFDNNPESRQFQDAGLDGLRSVDETTRFAPFLQNVRGAVTDPNALAALDADPSSDNFDFPFDTEKYPNGTGLLERYVNFNGVEGNSRLNEPGDVVTRSVNPNPDVEDINADNTLNTTEAFYQYRLSIRPQDMVVGRNYIVDRRDTIIKTPNNQDLATRWYLFRIPLLSGSPVGNIQNFKAIDFIRMYMTNFDKEIIMRFGKLELVSTQWRLFREALNSDGEGLGTDPLNSPTRFDIGTVNIEENKAKQPFNYVIPPNIVRAAVPGAALPGILQNEQALMLRTCGLGDGDSRGVFRNLNYDLRNYGRIKMWIHAEPLRGVVQHNFDQCGDLKVFLRIGTDLTDNYYEYELPICPSDSSALTSDPEVVWPEANQIDFAIETLQLVKSLRNEAQQQGTATFIDPYTYVIPDGRGHRITVVGNPQLNNVKSVLIGIRNPVDDGQEVCAEIWANELRVTDFNTETAWAANARVNVKLADLGSVSLSMSKSTPYFGSIEKTIQQRSLQDFWQYNIAANIQAGKLLPKAAGLDIPVYFTFGERVIEPLYNPLDPDIKLTTLLQTIENPDARQQAYDNRIDYTKTYSYSFTNVRKLRTNLQAKPKPWDLANWAFTYGYNERYFRNGQVESYINAQHQFGVMYAFQWQPPKVQFFKPKPDKKPNIFHGIHFFPLPKAFTFKVDGNYIYEEQRLRAVSPNALAVPPTYQQNFLITRVYGLQWDLWSGLNFSYNATNISRVDVPFSNLDTPEERDTLWSNFLSFGENRDANRYNMVNMGRTIDFTQQFTASYRLPFMQIKPLNWINGSVNYTGGFRWQTAPLGRENFGNTIGNNRNIQFTAQLNMANLYKKFPIIEKILKPIPKKNVVSLADSTRQEGDGAEVAFKGIGKTIAGWIFSIQSIDFSYGITQSSTLPGYRLRTDNFGFDWNYTDPTTGQVSLAPGWEYIAGAPPNLSNTQWLTQAANQGWLSSDPLFLTPFQKSDARNFNARTALTLFPGFRVDLNATYQSSETMGGLFNFDSTSGEFKLSNQSITGSLTLSTLTGFGSFESLEVDSKSFQTFSDNRLIISQRLAEANPQYAASLQAAGYESIQNSRGYYNGYTGSSQEVLIPSFLAAYMPFNVGTMSLSPFPSIPLPNWSVNYNGLQSIDLFKNIFKTITLKHAYRGTYTSNYILNLNYLDPDGDGFANVVQEIDSSTNQAGQPMRLGNFYSQYTIQTISLTESWAPLLGINMEFKNGIGAMVDFKRNRTLTFNVGALQLMEMASTELTVNLSYRRDKGLAPFTIFGRSFELKNSITFRLELTYRGNKTQNRRLDATTPPEPTGGNLNLIIKPSIDYMINTQVSIRAYFEYNSNTPVLSTSFPTSFTAFGIQVRFTLK